MFEARSGRSWGRSTFSAQGTLYPDVIEIGLDRRAGGRSSRAITTSAACRNACGSKLVEPLRQLFKDEVRAVGHDLRLDEEFVVRQPFPGPGLAVRLARRPDAPERLDLLRRADAIVARGSEARPAGIERLWQSFAVLLPVQSVGVMGDERTYEYTVAIRAVESRDGMTADWARLPHELLASISSRIVNEVRGINRVVYDISIETPIDDRMGVGA